MNDRLKPGKLLNLFGISGIKQGSFQYHSFDIQGAGFFLTLGVLIDSTGTWPNLSSNRHFLQTFTYSTKSSILNLITDLESSLKK